MTKRKLTQICLHVITINSNAAELRIIGDFLNNKRWEFSGKFKFS